MYRLDHRVLHHPVRVGRMVEGEPERDVFAMDVARFGKWITPGYTVPKVVENYQRRFSVSYPNEELPAARPLDTTPAYGIWKAQNDDDPFNTLKETFTKMVDRKQ